MMLVLAGIITKDDRARNTPVFFLEDPMDRETWRASQGSQGWTQLKL